MVRTDANTNPHRRAEKVQMSATTLRVAPIRTCPAPAADTDLLGDEIQTPRTNIRFGWPGCPDVLGQLKDGRFLGVEVKAQAGRLRPEQALFLARIRAAGGVAFVARDCRDVLRTLGEAQAP